MSTVPFYIQLLNWNLFEGSMQYFPPHLNFERLSEKLIPDKDFSGKIITDFGGNWTQDPELQDQHSNHWATQVVKDGRAFCNTWTMSGTAWFLKRVNACIQLVHYLNLPHLNWNGLFPFTKKMLERVGIEPWSSALLSDALPTELSGTLIQEWTNEAALNKKGMYNICAERKLNRDRNNRIIMLPWAVISKDWQKWMICRAFI